MLRNCRTLEELRIFVKGRLSAETDLEVIDHILQCRQCRAHVIAFLNEEAARPERRAGERRQAERRQTQDQWSGPERRLFDRRQGDRRHTAALA